MTKRQCQRDQSQPPHKSPGDIQTDLVAKKVLGQVECQRKKGEERLSKSKYFFAVILWLEEIIVYLEVTD